jgi:hypothetical protein
MAAAKQVDICLGCDDKLKKSEMFVMCTVCGLWCHEDCEAISNKFLKCLEEQKKNTGLAYWACTLWIVYGRGTTKHVQEIEKRLATVKEKAKKTVEKRGDQQDKVGGKIDKKIEQIVTGLRSRSWSRSRPEPKLLGGARAGAGILKFRLPAPAPGQTKVVYLIIIHIK